MKIAKGNNQQAEKPPSFHKIKKKNAVFRTFFKKVQKHANIFPFFVYTIYMRTTKETVKIPHDNTIKKITSIRKNCLEFLKLFLSIEILKKLDMRTLAHFKEGHVNANSKESRMDAVFKIRKKGHKQKQCVYIIFEHKSYVDKKIISQISQYVTSIIKYQEDNNEKLQPIYPIVFYHGKRKWTLPQATPKEVFDYTNLPYQFIDLNRVDIDQLDTTNNMKLIIYVFQNITEFKYLEKLERIDTTVSKIFIF